MNFPQGWRSVATASAMMFFAVALPAQAVTLVLNSATAQAVDTNGASLAGNASLSTAFTDFYSFTTASTFQVTASVDNAIADISNFAIKLVSGIGSGGSNVSTPGTGCTVFPCAPASIDLDLRRSGCRYLFGGCVRNGHRMGQAMVDPLT